MLKKVLTNKRGEMYIGAVVTIIVVIALLVFSLTVMRVATVANTANTIADLLIETATYYGSFGTEFQNLEAELHETYNLEFTVEYDGDWYNTGLKRVQLGDTMTVTVKYNFTFGGFGKFLTVPLKSVRSGASENYWKTA